jgi:hypothetical protein
MSYTPQQIVQHDPQQLTIALDDPHLGNDESHLALRLELAQFVRHGLRQGAQIDRFPAQLATPKQFEANRAGTSDPPW